MSRPIELHAAYFTLAGDVYPGGPNEISPWPFEERVAAAAEAGFRGFGFFYGDLVTTEERLGLPAMRRILDEHGMVHVELEFLGDWFADGERRAESDRQRGDFLRAAEALGARQIKIGGDLTGEKWPLEPMVRDFRTLCREADAVGSKITLELMPFSSHATLEHGLELVETADEPNGGLCLDIWHLLRAGVKVDEVRDIPGNRIVSIELNDGPAAPPPGQSLWDDAVENRTFCGDGEFPIAEFLAALDAAGFDGPYGIEIMGVEYRKLPLRETAQRVYETTMAQFTNTVAA
jgi:sugar phosphate isomerase/epimerase